jgi:xanthine/CO dehydrogenase XdhC/CoxF family maturation factor
VKQWQESAAVLGRAERLAEAGQRAVIATVVRIAGSAYRRPGAKLLVEESGRTAGGVSGGCLEADVREVARLVLAGSGPRLLHYDTAPGDEDPFGLGLGCGGSVDVFVQSATSPPGLETVRRCLGLLAGEVPFAVSTVLEGALAGRSIVLARGAPTGSVGDLALDRGVAGRSEEMLATGRSTRHEVGPLTVFTEVLHPPPQLAVVGAGDDAMPLVRLARDAGFRVTVVDHRPALLSRERFPGARLVETRPEDRAAPLPIGPNTFAVVKMHGLAHDREWVRRLLGSGVRYLGVLGPRERVRRVLGEAEAARDARVHGPVGLDLGAEGPEQVAVSIVAELLAVHSGRVPGHLREGTGPIHAR